jgi:acyl-CoA reductase-like NAD-dependent aldehyde dehydrogenase
MFRRAYGPLIGGRIASSAEKFTVWDPARRVPLCEVGAADEHHVQQAVQHGLIAFNNGTWSQASPQHRAAVLLKIATALRNNIDRFAIMESLQTGRPLREMKAQLARLPEWFEYFSALARTFEGSVTPFTGNYLNYVERVPLGVVAQITPWNHPLLIAVKKLSVALAAGNSVVLKPSELAPASVIELGEMIIESGIPEDVLSILPGVGASTGKALVSNPLISKVDLTGGTETGRAVGSLAGKALNPIIAELGGKSPVIIFSDADIEQAVNGAAFAAFIASGQTCIMGSRIIVHEDIYEAFSKAFVEKVSAIRLGDPQHEATQMGPVISEGQLSKVTAFVDLAKEEGADILFGGACPSSQSIPEQCRNGWYYQPTVIGGPKLHEGMKIVSQEVFGPVVVIYTFRDEADAVYKANASEFGLAASVWTRDIKLAHRMAKNLQAGIIWINDHHRNDPSSPWGGMKNSGFGRENGLDAYREYTQSKSVIVNTSDQKFDWFVSSTVRYS